MTLDLNSDHSKQKEQIRALDKKTLSALYSALKNAKLYPPGHPSFREGANRLVSALQEVFNNRMEFALLQTDGLFQVEDNLLIEESLRMYDLLHCLEEWGLARLLFLPGVTAEEISQLLIYLTQAKVPGASAPLPFVSEHIRSAKETKKAEISAKDRSLTRIREAGEILQEWTERTGVLFANLLDEQTLSISELSDPLENLIDAIHRNPSLFSIAWVTHAPENLHRGHAIRTTILAIYVGQQLNLDFSSLKTLALAALFHDIGREFLPTEFSTGHVLEAGDIELIHAHARDGASYLAGVSNLPVVAARVALEHHLGYDGIGYPSLSASHRPHIFSQLVSICDFVSWGTVSEKFYHRAVPLHKLIRSLIRRAGTQFNPLLVKLLLPFFGLYPTGTRLRLTTGEYAVSLEPNTRNITRPALGCVNPQGGMDFRWISHVENLKGESFATSIHHSTGYDSNIKSILPLIPNLFETDT